MALRSACRRRLWSSTRFSRSYYFFSFFHFPSLRIYHPPPRSHGRKWTIKNGDEEEAGVIDFHLFFLLKKLLSYSFACMYVCVCVYVYDQRWYYIQEGVGWHSRGKYSVFGIIQSRLPNARIIPPSSPCGYKISVVAYIPSIYRYYHTSWFKSFSPLPRSFVRSLKQCFLFCAISFSWQTNRSTAKSRCVFFFFVLCAALRSRRPQDLVPDAAAHIASLNLKTDSYWNVS